MPNTSDDPVDHARTTRQHAGESMKDGTNAPGLIGMAAAVVALVAGLFAFATGHATIGIAAVIVALAVGGAGSLWLALRHRQVRQDEKRWHDAHPGAPEEPPTS